jgi:hypothetical protein
MHEKFRLRCSRCLLHSPHSLRLLVEPGNLESKGPAGQRLRQSRFLEKGSLCGASLHALNATIYFLPER